MVHVVAAHNVNLDSTDPAIVDLVRQAQEADEADHQLTVRQALSKYKKAVFWAMFLSLSLVMEGYDTSLITSLYGQTQFKERFGEVQADGALVITAHWQSVLSNMALVGQIVGLIINMYVQDKFGARHTMMFFMAWMALAIFGPVFAPSLSILALGEVLCGISWGVFQTLSTSYASEVVPTVLRAYVTAWVCMCWGTGILFASGVVRAIVGWQSDWGWRLPLCLQWIWPVPLFIGAYLAPESPWNAIRRDKPELAKSALRRLRDRNTTQERDIDAMVAYITHTTTVEKAEVAGAGFLECFKGTNLRRTEINCVVWAAQILCGNALLTYAVLFLQRAGFSEIQSFNLNISLSACYIVGGVLCWFLMSRVGRATIYMSGMAFMLCCMLAIGGLGTRNDNQANMAIGIILVLSTFVNMITIGPVCYPIVAETPSGRLRHKTITIGRTIYVCTQIFNNSVTPRMLSTADWNWGAKSAFFFAGTNLLCLTWCWFRLPETKGRTFGEIDLLFENRVPARKFKYTKADQFASTSEEIDQLDLVKAEKDPEIGHHERI